MEIVEYDITETGIFVTIKDQDPVTKKEYVYKGFLVLEKTNE